MKLSKKFIEDLHKIGEDAFIEKNQWIGKLVPDIIIDNLQKRGLSQDDIEGIVCLTLDEAKAIAYKLGYLGALTTQSKTEKETLELTDMLWWRIEQAEKCDGKNL